MLIKFEVKMKLSVICLLCLLSERFEQVMDVIHGERRLTKDTHDFKDGSTNLEVVLDDGNEPAVQFKLLSDAFSLGHSHHVKSELLKDAMLSESIGLRQHLSVDRLVAKSEVFRLLGMGGCYICEFPKASAAHKLTEHQNQQMVPMRHRPALGPVVVLGEYSPELPLREKLYYLCKNECPYMHICSDFESDAKVSISKPGQGIGGLKRCA